MASGIRLMEKVLFKVAKQWIAGDTIDDALSAAKDAYRNKRHAIINKLGEYHKSKNPIQKTISEYQKIISLDFVKSTDLKRKGGPGEENLYPACGSGR